MGRGLEMRHERGWGGELETDGTMGKRVEGLQAKGTRYRTMRTGQTMAGGGEWEGEVRGAGVG